MPVIAIIAATICRIECKEIKIMMPPYPWMCNWRLPESCEMLPQTQLHHCSIVGTVSVNKKSECSWDRQVENIKTAHILI